MQNLRIVHKIIKVNLICMLDKFDEEGELTEQEILDKAYSRKTKRYLASKVTDNSLHSNII